MKAYIIDTSSLSPSERDSLSNRLSALCWEVYMDSYAHVLKIMVDESIDPLTAFSLPDSCPIRPYFPE